MNAELSTLNQQRHLPTYEWVYDADEIIKGTACCCWGERDAAVGQRVRRCY